MITLSLFSGMRFQPVQLGQILPGDYMGKSNFIPARRDSFAPGICLDLFLFLFFFLCKHVLNYVFVPLRRTEMITWENYIPARRDPSIMKKGSGLAGMKLVICNRRMLYMKSLENRRDQCRGHNFIPCNRDHVITTLFQYNNYDVFHTVTFFIGRVKVLNNLLFVKSFPTVAQKISYLYYDNSNVPIFVRFWCSLQTPVSSDTISQL